ncbi:hypothetical protein N7497_004094 [Penicillium chrysogenum]|nr:hypothetical protein N7524_004568 [Penicillium chrysogenum]KAJ6159557.1 hypothetical protein N7497_004094 [Penicillium chrysogenum]
MSSSNVPQDVNPPRTSGNSTIAPTGRSAYEWFGHIYETPQGSLTLADSPLGQINKICGPSHLKDAELLQAIDKRIASIDKALREEDGNRLRRFETTERPTWLPTWLFPACHHLSPA